MLVTVLFVFSDGKIVLAGLLESTVVDGVLLSGPGDVCRAKRAK